MKFEIYLNRKRRFKWRLRASNGVIIATCGSQAYSRRKDCVWAVSLIRSLNNGAEVLDLTKGKRK